jgi:PKD repeat protein
LLRRKVMAIKRTAFPVSWVHLLAAVVVAALGVPAMATSARAQSANDDFGSATAITLVPFGDIIDTTGTTLEPGEPQPCVSLSQSVWYIFRAPTAEVVEADNIGTGFATDLNVYEQTGSGFGGLSLLGCGQESSPMVFVAQAGTTYYIQTGILFGASGELHVNLTAPPPPPNDEFANATPVSSLPFSGSADTTAASAETGEPTPSCASFFPVTGSVWYSFTPSLSETVSVNSPGSTVVAAYTGSGLSNLTELGSACFGGTTSVHLDAGTTYYFKVAGLFGTRGLLTIDVFVTRPPIASFFVDPPDPSILDTVSFVNNSADPGELGFQDASWDFGDGTTATTAANPVTHRYATDGDYVVTLRVTTTDGRTGTYQQALHVGTHDVWVSQLSVPMAAKPGQTRLISVAVRNSRYPEAVRVDFYESVGSAFVQVGSVTQSVPVRGSQHPTSFSINYTFTSNDAAAGKVVFEAVATIQGYRDVFPTDNTAVSGPVKVGS